MLVKVCNQIVRPIPLINKEAAKHERKVVPIDTKSMRYLRFRAIGNMEIAGQNGNHDGFPYEHFEDSRPGYGYKSFMGKRAHAEHNSQTGNAGSIGDLPDAYLNRFIYPDDVEKKEWKSLLGNKWNSKREAILSAPGQKMGDIEVLMRIDTQLVKSAQADAKVRSLLERIIRMIDTGQQLTCSMGCFTDGVPVLVSNGIYRSIEKIRVGELVLTHTGKFQKVTDTFVRMYNGPLYEITVAGRQGPIKVTPDHLVLVKKARGLCACGCGQYVKYANRTWVVGHRQKIFNTNPNKHYSEEYLKEQRELIEKRWVEDNLEWAEVRDLSKKDYLVYPILKTVIDTPHITPGKAKLVGYFLAEGSYLKYTDSGGNTYKTAAVFSFGNTEKDEKFVEEVINLCKQEWSECDPKVYKATDYIHEENKHKYAENIKGCIEVRIHSKTVAQFFEFYCGEYSLNKCIPEEVLFWNCELQKHLLGGYFNGDGTEVKTGNCTTNVMVSTISESLAYQISYILSRLGIPSALTHTFHETWKNRAYTIIVRGHWINILSEYWGYGKYQNSEESEEHSQSHFKISDKFILIPIKGIRRYLYTGPVYNLEVEEDQSYIVHGISVHNCNVSFSDCSVCGNTARFASEYCKCLKSRKGALTIVPANQVRDLLDQEKLRPEWLKHIVASKFDVGEILKGASNKGIAMRNVEINHEASFFELSIVAIPAYSDAKMLEKLAKQVGGDYKEYLRKIREQLGDEALLDIYSLMQEDSVISSLCEVK